MHAISDLELISLAMLIFMVGAILGIVLARL